MEENEIFCRVVTQFIWFILKLGAVKRIQIGAIQHFDDRIA